jgi:hypothetical protein
MKELQFRDGRRHERTLAKKERVRHMERATIRTGLAASALMGFCTISEVAHAVTCDAIPNPNDGQVMPVVYVEGANAVGPFLVPLQQALSTDSNPVAIVYIGDGGCLGANNFFSSTPISNSPKPIYYSGQAQLNCELPTPTPVADIVATDVYAPSCGTVPGGSLPVNIGAFEGPVQVMTFVVPKGSSQKSISASAAYFTFGFGAASGVAPWTVPASMYRRNASSAVQAFLAIAIGVPLTQWAGVDAAALDVNKTAGLSGAAAVINGLMTDANPEQAIGILAATNLDATTMTRLNILAYKDFGQNCAYYPDSTVMAHDKMNVRDGHYTLWGPIRFFTYINENGVPRNSQVARLISYITGTTLPPRNVDFVQVEAANNLVPLCAMRVTRSVEMGPMSSYAPPSSCGCYFEYVATGQTSCHPCSKRSDCPTSAPVCNTTQPVGFCETQ